MIFKRLRNLWRLSKLETPEVIDYIPLPPQATTAPQPRRMAEIIKRKVDPIDEIVKETEQFNG